jgi:hypothetical protein
LAEGIVKRHWTLANERTKATEIVIQSKVKEMLAELHGELSGEQLWVNKTLDKINQLYCWLHSTSDFERWCQQCDTWQTAEVPEREAGIWCTRKTLGRRWEWSPPTQWTFPPRARMGINTSCLPWITSPSGRRFSLSLTDSIDSDGRPSEKLLLMLRGLERTVQ